MNVGHRRFMLGAGDLEVFAVRPVAFPPIIRIIGIRVRRPQLSPIIVISFCFVLSARKPSHDTTPFLSFGGCGLATVELLLRLAPPNRTHLLC